MSRVTAARSSPRSSTSPFAPNPRIHTTITAAHQPCRSPGTGLACQRHAGGSSGPLARQMSSMICFGRTKLRNGTNQPPTAQVSPNRSPTTPSGWRLRYRRRVHAMNKTAVTAHTTSEMAKITIDRSSAERSCSAVNDNGDRSSRPTSRYSVTPSPNPTPAVITQPARHTLSARARRPGSRYRRTDAGAVDGGAGGGSGAVDRVGPRVVRPRVERSRASRPPAPSGPSSARGDGVNVAPRPAAPEWRRSAMCSGAVGSDLCPDRQPRWTKRPVHRRQRQGGSRGSSQRNVAATRCRMA